MKLSAVVLSACLLLWATAFGEERGPDWVRVTNRAGWQPRDSSGEVVFKDQLWILGGWFDSFAAPPRDVWCSPDGKNWKQVTKEAPWKHSDLPMTLVFKDRMWLMGGWFNGRLPGHSASNEVWSSPDGVTWVQATKNAGWSPGGLAKKKDSEHRLDKPVRQSIWRQPLAAFLGRHGYDADVLQGRSSWGEFVPGIHVHVNDRCWLSGGLLVPLNAVDKALHRFHLTCSWQF